MSRPAQPEDDDSADLTLVNRLRGGDPTAVDDLYTRFKRPAFTLARRILADDALAEDVVQDAFVSVWRDPTAFDQARGSLSAWLLAMVHHKAVDALRREQSHHRRLDRVQKDAALRAPTADRDVEEEAWSRMVSERVRLALAAIPQAQREALTMAYFGGYTQREIAAVTGTPLGTVKTRMLAGMRRLRGDLAPGPGGGALSDPIAEEGTAR